MKKENKKKLSSKKLGKIFAVLMLLLMTVPIFYGAISSMTPYFKDKINNVSK